MIVRIVGVGLVEKKVKDGDDGKYLLREASERNIIAVPGKDARLNRVSASMG